MREALLRGKTAGYKLTPSAGKTHASHSKGAQGEWGNIITPLCVSVWERKLSNHPDREFAKYVCDGIREGFRVGFDYTKCRCRQAQGI